MAQPPMSTLNAAMATATIAIVGRTPNHTECIVISESNELRLAPNGRASAVTRDAYAARSDSGDALGYSAINPDGGADAIVGFGGEYIGGDRKDRVIDTGRHDAGDGTDAAALPACMIVGRGLPRLVGRVPVVHAMIAVQMAVIGACMVARGVGGLGCARGRGRVRRDALPPRRAAGDE